MSDFYLGLITGTSLDGVDLALVEIPPPQDISEPRQGFAPKLTAFESPALPDTVRAGLLAVQDPQKAAPLSLWPALHAALGHFFADAVSTFLTKVGMPTSRIRALGFHGVTIRHEPESIVTPVGEGRGTLQGGDPWIVAQRTGLPVVADLRAGDMAVGGEGAPLAPFLDHLLFRDEKVGRILLNLGGIANATFLPPNSRAIAAFDTGPANMLIDALMRRHPTSPQDFDPDGRFAARGAILPELLAECAAHPYFVRKAPKSTGRELFNDDFLAPFLRAQATSYEDRIASATALTAQTVADALTNLQPDQVVGDYAEVLVSGGGAHNRTLMGMLVEKLPTMQVRPIDKVNVDAKEALLMATLAWAHVHGVTGNEPGVTGASKRVVLGSMVRL